MRRTTMTPEQELKRTRIYLAQLKQLKQEVEEKIMLNESRIVELEDSNRPRREVMPGWTFEELMAREGGHE